MELSVFFGSPVVMIEGIVDENYNHEIVAKLEEIQEEKPESRHNWACDIYTTHRMYDLRESKLFFPLLKRQAELVAEFANKITNKNDRSSTVLNSWFNVSKKHQYQEQHIHTDSHISTVYYAKAPEGSAPTIFRPPNPEMLSFGSTFYNEIVVPPKERALLIFCSNTPHLTGQQSVDDTRITVATNFSIGE